MVLFVQYVTGNIFYWSKRSNMWHHCSVTSLLCRQPQNQPLFYTVVLHSIQGDLRVNVSVEASVLPVGHRRVCVCV